MLMKELILSKLQDQKKALTVIEINNLLGLSSVEEYQSLQKELNELVSEGKVHRTKKDKYVMMDNCSSLFSGIVHINKKGNGFVDIHTGEDIFVSKENLNGAIDGDLVEVDVQSTEGVIVNILKRDLSLVVGEIVSKHNKLSFEIDDKKKDIAIEVTASSIAHCVEGHKVLVKITKELKNNYYLGEVIKILGHKNDPGVDIMSIACEHNIIIDFPEAVLNEVKTLPTSVSEKDIKDRRDLRKEVIFTIDGDDTKDIDDAISIKKVNNNYLLGVHIADVSYYVKEKSA
jgi:ribonuclease R